MRSRIVGAALLAGILGLGLAGPAGSIEPSSEASNPDQVKIDIIYTSDIHGHIDRQAATFLNPQFPPPLGGGASAATYIKTVREQAAREGHGFILIDAGDMFQGTPLGIQSHGKAIIDWMNDMGYTAATLGNHDFDLGWENAREMVREAKFPILGGNIYNSATQKPVDWVKDHTMVDAAGVKVAIVGMITEATVKMSFAKNIEGLTFVPVNELLPVEIEKVRAAGAQIVIFPVHAGLPYKPTLQQYYRDMVEQESRGERPSIYEAMQLAHYFPGIDLIIASHSHQGYDVPWEDPVTHTVVVEPYANGSSVGHITITFDKKAGMMTGYETHNDRGALATLYEDEFWPDQGTAETVAQEVEQAEKGLDEVIGETRVNLVRGDAEKGNLGGLVADSMREFLGADVAVQNTGGVRADIAPGPITKRNTLEVLPFGNTLVTARVKGEFLKRLFEQKVGKFGPSIFVSGVTIEYDPLRPEGERILSFKVGDAPLDPDREYKLALTNYLVEGNSGMSLMREIPDTRLDYTQNTDREALEKYVTEHTPVNPKSLTRWTKVGT